ncbi:glycosyltransferase [Candidatus Dojkabacteria bacterium]|nr:glycosyltransferase [Candidatus Dojkabacteria bacterium]
MRRPNLTIVIPAYNEEKRIGATLESLGRYFASKNASSKDFNAEILVVINNTKDNTEKVVKKYKKDYPFIKYINIPMYTGKGGAIAAGFEIAKGEYVGFMDSDNATKIQDYMKMYRQLAKNKQIDGVIANRYMEGSKIIGGRDFKRTIFSRVFNMLVARGLFQLNTSDTQCGYKIFTREAAKLLANKISTVGWLFDLNILLLSRYLGLEIKDVPVKWEEKGNSTISASRNGMGIIKEIVELKKQEIRYNQNVSRFEEKSLLLQKDLMSNKNYPWKSCL